MSKGPFDRVDIELFLALATGGRLQDAAKATGIHHATAFRRLEDVEAKAGARLFERAAGSYRLTAAGSALVGPAREIRDRLLEFDARVLSYDTALSGPVRLTSSDGLALGYLPELIARFTARWPEICVTLRVENEISDLAAREVDVALRPARRLSGNMVGRRAAMMAYALYASPGYVRTRPPINGIAPELSGHDVIGYEESMKFYSTARWLDRHARRARTPASVNSLHAMLALARAGVGIAAIPCIIGDGAPGLERLTPPIESMTTGLWVCTHPDIRNVARVRVLLDFLYDAAVRDRARLAGSAPAEQVEPARIPEDRAAPVRPRPARGSRPR